MRFKIFFILLQIWATFDLRIAQAQTASCEVIFAESKSISRDALATETTLKIPTVAEFRYIRELAEKMGFRVWLFGGSAASFLHYVKSDLAQTRGHSDRVRQRYDYEFNDIFRSTQDFDIVVDASPTAAAAFQTALFAKYPFHLGTKRSGWEVRSLRENMGLQGAPGFKEALLHNSDFSNQNSDSNSIGLVEISKSREFPIRDLRNWDAADNLFLTDISEGKISFLRSPQHFTTARAQAGENPEILSVVRFLAKSFQYDAAITENDFQKLKEIVDNFDATKLKNQPALDRLKQIMIKLVRHATDIELAMNTLDRLGLRSKLIALGNKDEIGSAAWWLNKEPLRSFAVGTGSGRTAAETAASVGMPKLSVTHETNSFAAFESILRSSDKGPNVLVSRPGFAGETAVHGSGFYVRVGTEGIATTNRLIQLEVRPDARENTDFKFVHISKVDGDVNYLVVLNKAALRVVPVSLEIKIDDYLTRFEKGLSTRLSAIDLSIFDLAKRKFNPERIIAHMDVLLNAAGNEGRERLLKILAGMQMADADSNKLEFTRKALDAALANGDVTDPPPRLIESDVFSVVSESMLNRFENLPKSGQEADIQTYIRLASPLMNVAPRIPGDASASHRARFQNILKDTLRSQLSYATRQLAANELVLLESKEDDHFGYLGDLQFPHAPTNKTTLRNYGIEAQLTILRDLQKSFSADEYQMVLASIRRWDQSVDARKRKFGTSLFVEWVNAIDDGDVNLLERISNTGVLDINSVGVSGYSSLMLAAYYQQKPVFDWILSKKDFDLNRKDGRGFNQIDQLRRLGFEKLAKEVQIRNPQITSVAAPPKEREGHLPVVAFVPVIERGEERSFFMHSRVPSLYNKVTLTRPFAILSTEVPQGIWYGVVDLVGKFFPNASDLRLKPQVGELTRSAVAAMGRVSYANAQLWIAGLNRLSRHESPSIQVELQRLLPGHQMNDVYRLPTFAERNFVQRNLGLSYFNGYSFGRFSQKDVGNVKLNEALSESTQWSYKSDTHHPAAVGMRKPIFIHGKPVYDLQGNVDEWVSDWSSELPEGRNPQGPATGTSKFRLGGDRSNGSGSFDVSYSGYHTSDLEINVGGLRLVREGR